MQSWGGRIGFGAMHLSEAGRPPREQAVATMHAALDAGVRLIDTADAYCLDRSDTGHNERLVAEAVRAWSGPRDHVTIATKGGHVRDASGGWGLDGRPEHLYAAAEASCRRLNVEAIDLYHLHRPDPAVPWERSVMALEHLQNDGVVVRVGVSNVDADLLRRACDRLWIASVQNELSPYNLDGLPVLVTCHRAGIPFIVWGPFGGATRAGRLGSDAATAAFADCAGELGVSTHQAVLAWLLSLSPVVTVIPGGRSPASIVDSAGAAHVVLDAATRRTLDNSVIAHADAGAARWLGLLRAAAPSTAVTVP